MGYEKLFKTSEEGEGEKRHHHIPQFVVNGISLNCPSLIQLQAENYKIL